MHRTRAGETSATIGITDLKAARNTLEAERDRYASWKDAHQPQLDQLSAIEATISAARRSASQGLDGTRSAEAEHDTALGLGL